MRLKTVAIRLKIKTIPKNVYFCKKIGMNFQTFRNVYYGQRETIPAVTTSKNSLSIIAVAPHKTLPSTSK